MTAFQTSAYSLKAIAAGLLPLMSERGGAIVSLDFDATQAWPAVRLDGRQQGRARVRSRRYLARDLGQYGIRVNCVSAGPLRTMAAKGIPGFHVLAGVVGRSGLPLGWDVKDPEPVARTVAFLLSDWARAITGEIVHVDGGYHAMGARAHPPPEEAGSAASPSGEDVDGEAPTEVAQVADAAAGEAPAEER